MTNRIIAISALLLGMAAPSALAGFDTATFSDTGLTLTSSGLPTGVGGAYNNNSKGFTSGGQYFNNNYNPTYGSWDGFAVSTTTNTTLPGYTNQYSAITGAGNTPTFDPQGKPVLDPYYAVLYSSAYVNLTGNVQSIDLTNTTYAYLSMLSGDQFAKKFTTNDFFDVVITGYTGLGGTGTTTGFKKSYLANYASPTDLPISTWNTLNLTVLGNARSIGFSFESSDVGMYGINTPAYVAVDNLVVSPSFVPEPSSWLLCATGLGIGVLVRRRRVARLARL